MPSLSLCGGLWLLVVMGAGTAGVNFYPQAGSYSADRGPQPAVRVLEARISFEFDHADAGGREEWGHETFWSS